jgi:hypothetical protein
MATFSLAAPLKAMSSIFLRATRLLTRKSEQQRIVLAVWVVGERLAQIWEKLADVRAHHPELELEATKSSPRLTVAQ